MLPDQFIRVSIRGIGRKIEKPQLAVETGDERLGLFCDMRGPAVNDQKNLVLGPDHEPPEKLNEHIGIDAALDRKSTRLNSSHANISYAVFCLKKKKRVQHLQT